jgi:hypothetical protein
VTVARTELLDDTAVQRLGSRSASEPASIAVIGRCSRMNGDGLY